MAISKKKIGLTLKVLALVVGFIALFLGVVYGLISSKKFTITIANRMVEHLKAKGKSASFENLTGTLKDSIAFDKLTIKDSSNGEEITIEKANMALDMGYLLQNGVFSFIVDAKSAVLKGKFFQDFDLTTIPAFTPLACLSYWQADTEIGALSLEKLTFVSNEVGNSKLDISDLEIVPTEKYQEKTFSANFELMWKDRAVGVASWSGVLNQRGRKINSKLQFAGLGQKIKTELNISRKRNRNIEYSGYLSEASIDVDSLSNWLISYWQDEFPFTFGGKINFSGSWLYNGKVGFLGNLSGECNNLSAIALGFFYKIFELNNQWKYLNENILIEDKGSKFLGVEARLNGKVESIFDEEDRKFDLAFNCTDAEGKDIIESLPWALRYALKMPSLDGKLRLSAIATGREPSTTIRLSSLGGVKVGDEEGAALVKGSGSWLFSRRQNHCEANLVASELVGMPKFFKRGNLVPLFRGGQGKNLILSYKINGDPTGDLYINGTFENSRFVAGGAESLLATVTGAFDANNRIIKIEGEDFSEVVKDAGICDFLLLR